MSATDETTLHATTGPDASLSEKEKEQLDAILPVIEDVPEMTDEEIVERYDLGGSGARYLERNRKKHQLPRYDLPGFGAKRDDCGRVIPHICTDCGDDVDVGRTCAQSKCPRCASKWVMDRAEVDVANIIGAARMKDGTQYKHHAVVSPPIDHAVDDRHPDETPTSIYMDAMHDFADAIDFDGLIVPHPWTGDHGGDFVDDHTDDRGEWKNRLFNYRDWEGDVREELKHRPHFHLIGTCPWFPGGGTTRELYDRTGWIVHRITERNGSAVSLGGIEAVARASCYAISHSPIDTSGERNRWVHKRVGSAYHAAKNSSHPAQKANRREAKEAVKKVAPDVLGIPSHEISCDCEVPADEVEHEHDHTVDGKDATTTDDDGVQQVQCRGDLVAAPDADFVEDPEWQQTALFAEHAVETRKAWFENGGWDGWIGADLNVEIVDHTDDEPPPD